MAEPEELISDAARHATVFARSLWRRYRPPAGDDCLHLDEVAARVNLFLQAVFNRDFPIRVAQPPAHVTLLSRVFRQHPAPRRQGPVAATDGHTLWLPARAPTPDSREAACWFRTLALVQAMRAERGSAHTLVRQLSPLQRAVYLLLEAQACDLLLAQRLPGCIGFLRRLRHVCLLQRPPLERFSPEGQLLEKQLRRLLQSEPACAADNLPFTTTPTESLRLLPEIIRDWSLEETRGWGRFPLLQDNWTGDLLVTDRTPDVMFTGQPGDQACQQTSPRSARLERTPETRQPRAGEDDPQQQASPWMVQLDEPHRMAADPMGLQRPSDRDQESAAEDYADMVSELEQARLVRTPEPSREFLLSDDTPPVATLADAQPQTPAGEGLYYPEWDYRSQSYRHPGARLFVLPAGEGSQEWIDAILQCRHAQLQDIRRQFEMLKARRLWYRRQWDGHDIDLNAYTEALADFHAGQPFEQRLYQQQRAARRELAVTLLVDVSGSTDSWIAQHRRVIDVAREALLLVCIALDSLGEPWAALAFSGEGPQAVTVRELKPFTRSYSNEVALRISALEPEYYTRAGAAIRHATVGLMQQPALHRLLLILSDGKPNDRDEYNGRYGAEDMRQAVNEARLQGIQSFCLTIDRRGAAYLPQIFGTHGYALIQRPERLPRVLLEWIKRLITH